MSAASTSYEVPASLWIRDPVEWKLVNTSDQTATGVHWYRAGRNWRSVDTIVSELIPPGTSDETKARLIWQFVRTNVYHWWPGALGLDPHDPVALLNGYGYGFCDDVTAAVGALAEAAGLPSRFWILGSGEHTFPEIFYNGQWHVFDPDLMTLVLERDNRTVAGVDDMMADPGLVDRGGPGLVFVKELLARTSPTSYYEARYGYHTGHDVTWTLRPREQVTLRTQAPAAPLVQSGEVTFAPPTLSSGQIQMSVDVDDAPTLDALHAVTGLSVGKTGGQSVLRPSSLSSTGSAVISQRSPYPLLDSRLLLSGNVPAGTRLRVLSTWEGPTQSWDWLALADGSYRLHPAYVAEGAIGLYGDDGNFPAMHGVAPGVTGWVNFALTKSPTAGRRVRVFGDFYRHEMADDVRLWVSLDKGATWLPRWVQPTTGLVALDDDITDLVAAVEEFWVRVEVTPSTAFWTAGLNQIGFDGVEPLTYSEIASFAGTGVLVDEAIDLQPTTYGCRETPCYDVFAKIVLEASSSARPYVSTIGLDSGFQVSTAALPSYDTGATTLRLDQDAAVALELTHTWTELTGNETPSPITVPLSPANGATVSLDLPLMFAWQPTGTGSDVLQYRVQVCGDPICSSPIVAGFEHDSKEYVGPGVNGIGGDSDDRYYVSTVPSWLSPYRQVLAAGTVYYWRVRVEDVMGRWSPWSPTWSFTTAPPPTQPGITMTLTTNGGVPYFDAGQFEFQLAGTALSNVPMVSVEWQTDSGERGVATGTVEWAIPAVPLHPGTNVISVTATDAIGRRASLDVQAIVRSLSYTLAEGATGAFALDLSLANPNPEAARVAISYLLPDGAPVTDERVLPAYSRTSIRVNDVPGLSNTAVSTVVESLDTLPIAVERLMTWEGGAASHLAGAGDPRTTWYFAEGAQGYFSTYLLLANTGPIDADVEVRFLTESGQTVTVLKQVRAQSRVNVYAGDVPELVGKSFGMMVTSTRPIMAERAMYFGQGGRWLGGHDSPGAYAISSHWYFAEGASGPMFDTYFLLANPTTTTGWVTVKYLLASGEVIERRHLLYAQTRQTINAEVQDPRLANAAFSVSIVADVGIVAERSMYWSGEWYNWHEAHNAFGLTAPTLRWMLAEGHVGGAQDRATYILIGNPDASAAATVRVTLLREDGRPPLTATFEVGASSRFNVDVRHDFPSLDDEERFGALVESLSGVPIMVEHSLYWDVGSVFWAAGANATGIPLPR